MVELWPDIENKAWKISGRTDPFLSSIILIKGLQQRQNRINTRFLKSLIQPVQPVNSDKDGNRNNVL